MDVSQVFTIDFSEIQFYHESQLAIWWTDQECKEWDELAKEDHTYRLTPEEKKNTKNNGILLWTDQAKNGPMNIQSDFHRESRKQIEEPISPRQHMRMASFFKHFLVWQIWMELEMSS